MFPGGIEMEHWPNMSWEKYISFPDSCRVFIREEKLAPIFFWIVAVLEKKSYESTQEALVTILWYFFLRGVK